MVAAKIECQTHIDITSQAGSVIESTNLVLRKPVMDDAEILAKLANDRTVAEMTAHIPYPYKIEDAIAFLNHTNSDGCHALRYAIISKVSGQFMGMVAVEQMEGELVLGYWLGRPYRRCGFMSEAASTLLQYIFENSQVNYISSSARIINDGSRSILIGLGFKETGIGLVRSASLRGRVPVTHFQLSREDFKPKLV